jgi:hypothetical protein
MGNQRENIMDWNNILNWKLLKGSHDFPGPEGGTCINEAAIVAAGFEYRKVNNAVDCPPCFSRAIAAYAIGLNDRMPDDLRQELLAPFVTRLAGTADKPSVERERTEYISIQTVRRILPIALRAAKLEEHAAKCEAVKTLDNAREVARAAAANAASAAYVSAANAAACAAAANVSAYAANANVSAARKIFTLAVAILDEAIRLGNQAEPIETALVVSRMETIKRTREAVSS